MSDLIQHYMPVFRHFLDRIDDLAGKATADQLAERLTPDSFSALENFGIAQGYVLRSLCPLAGQPIPDLPDVADPTTLVGRGQEVRTHLDRLEGVSAQNTGKINHVAGKATLDQDPYDYIALYGAPNFFFHMNMGYAILRGAGGEIGKGDFDGFHSYPPGFSFVTGAQGQPPELAQ